VGEVHQVESGVDLATFVPKGRAVEAPSPDLVVGYLGRMSVEKNPIGFIEMAEKILARQPWVRFVLFGEGVLADEVEGRVRASKWKDSITYRGFVDHPGDAFAQIDILVVPSITDGRPATVMEASASSVPVLGAPVGGIHELVSDGQNGYLIPPTQPDRIAELLANWRHDPRAFSELRSTSRALAEARFDRERMMDDYAAVFAHLVHTAPRPLATAANSVSPASVSVPEHNQPEGAF
jgi:glycosyltransferase involved in cell wall biosynthesis